MGRSEPLSLTSYKLVWRISKGRWQLFKASQGAEHAEVPVVSDMCLCGGWITRARLLEGGWSRIHPWVGRTTGEGCSRWLLASQVSCSCISRCKSFVVLVPFAPCSCSSVRLRVTLGHERQDCSFELRIPAQGWRCVAGSPLCGETGERGMLMAAAGGVAAQGQGCCFDPQVLSRGVGAF